MPNPVTDLSDVTVVVTRPSHQAEALCQSIEDLGATAVRFPVIEIRPSKNVDKLKAQLRHLDKFQLAIFVSANAVFSTMKILENQRGWPTGLSIAAVGQATAKAIAASGLIVSHVSPEPYNSEALLGISELQSMHGQRVIIFRGNGGRELLAKTLRERGAEVEYAECYQRVMPTTNPSNLFQLWDEGRTMPFVVTSNEGLKNLHSMVGQSHQQSLLTSPLIVVSQRAVTLAKELGFTQIPLVAKNASSDAILTAIKQWKKV